MEAPSTSFGEIKHMPDRLAEAGFASVSDRKMTMKLGQAQPDEKLRSVSKSILLRTSQCTLSICANHELTVGCGTLRLATANVIKGREAGVCAIPGTPMGEGRVFPETENTEGESGP